MNQQAPATTTTAPKGGPSTATTAAAAGGAAPAVGLGPPGARRRMSGDDGMSTAEYAVGTVAACGFAAVLWAVVHSGAVHDALAQVLQHALSLGL